MIVTNISHGFGNQLFQYAAGYAAAKRAAADLRIDVRYFRRARDRRFELDKLTISAPRVTVVEELRVRLSAAPPTSRFAMAARRLPGLSPFEVIRESDMAFEPRACEAADNVALIGFWQDETYFADYREDLRREFAFKAPPNEFNRSIIDQIRSGPSISLHVRRGDYVRPGGTLSPCPIEYYRAALDRVASRRPGSRIFVFSDDPAWTKDNLRLPERSVFVTGNVGVSDVDDLRLMTHCDDFIIANSSFSWWGAWLSPAREKIIIAPRPWFEPGCGNEDRIVPQRWERVGPSA